MVTGVLLPVDGGNLAMNAGGSVDWKHRPTPATANAEGLRDTIEIR